jgi:hypothetical protein
LFEINAPVKIYGAIKDMLDKLPEFKLEETKKEEL